MNHGSEGGQAEAADSSQSAIRLSFQDRNAAIRAQLAPLLREVEGGHLLPVDFYCECTNQDCHDRIELTLPDYDRIHRYAGRFTVRPQHTTGLAEQVVERHPGYWVVEYQQ